MITNYDQDVVMKTKDLQKFLKIGRDKALALMKSDAFPSVKIGRDYFVTKKNVYAWLASYKHKEFLL